MLTRTVCRSFALRVNTKAIIAPSRGYLPLFSRDDLKRQIETPNFEEDRLKALEAERKQEVEDFHMNMKVNDANPANHIKNLRIRTLSPAEVAPVVPQVPIPDILVYRRDPPAPTISGRLGKCKGSVKKISPTMRLIRGMHVNDAMAEMEKTQKRVAKRIYSALKMVRDHALNKGFSELRLYVKDAITNRSRRIKGMRYHAKMRMGREKRDWCSLLIRLEERPTREFFKDIVGGKAAKGVVSLWKQKITSHPNSFDLIRKYQFLLTAKGRQQRREMIKRRAFSLQKALLVYSVLLGQRMSRSS